MEIFLHIKFHLLHNNFLLKIESVKMVIGIVWMAFPHWIIVPNIILINYNHSLYIHFESLQSMQSVLVNQVKNPIILLHYEKVSTLPNSIYNFNEFFSPTVPDGIPIGFRCVNKSSSSLSLEWHPPPRNTIHGEFIGYRLRYHKNGNSASLLVLHEREITIGDPEARVSLLKKNLNSNGYSYAIFEWWFKSFFNEWMVMMVIIVDDEQNECFASFIHT